MALRRKLSPGLLCKFVGFPNESFKSLRSSVGSLDARGMAGLTKGIHVFHCPEHCLFDLLHGWQNGQLPVEASRVISNHDRGPKTHVIRFLERHGSPYHYLHMTRDNKREDEILDLVKDTNFVVLARYMQILSGSFLRNYGKDIINIHHGLLLSFRGGNPSKQAFNSGAKLISATTPFVTEELDTGPIIEQMKSENLEKRCLWKAIKSYCELRVLPYATNKTVVF